MYKMVSEIKNLKMIDNRSKTIKKQVAKIVPKKIIVNLWQD
jgi:hypothetical protein